MNNSKYNVDFWITNIFSGIIAGILIGLGGWLFVLSKTMFSNYGQLIGAMLFPVGLYVICRIQAKLYTGKIGFICVEEDRLSYSLSLVSMLIGNAVGAILIGLCFSSFATPDMVHTVSAVTESKVLTDLNFPTFLLKSILCGALVFLAVYLYKRSDCGFSKFISILIPIFIFVYCGFDHCVADIFYFAASKIYTWNAVLFILVAIAGNSVGAIVTERFFKYSL